MGVISDTLQERDAQGRPDSSDAPPGEAETTSDPLPERIDPFIQQYSTETFDADTATVNQMLTAVIAVGNLS